ncbi:ATP-dependent RNA helicase [Klebsormidium nitens]|uniref:RNA helicase n=1 Tax=Klebsormidium nitens TaxID=105231 RepID=A0A1Y1HMW3_KLENI|nr:ATP-dependent RNA helicase [Klebsormidium nitens]|eukprot:GAQ79052.1 ATP-dependent RNA helicase [Klebsormidium nitens]
MEKELFAGLHFDRRRFKKEIELFNKAPAPGSSASQPITLDFTAAPKSSLTGAERPLKRAKVQAETGVELAGGKAPERAGGSKKKRKGAPIPDLPDDGSVRIFGTSGGASPAAKAADDAGLLPKSKTTNDERVALLRKEFKIKVAPSQGVPAPLANFSELRTLFSCPRYLLNNLAESGYSEPTPIQRQAIPAMLKGLEVFACAPTGSGKTVAFLLPILLSLKAPSKDGVHAIILNPTRELALQTHRELKKLIQGRKFRARIMTKATATSVDFAASPCDILVSTPLRLDHLVKEQKIDLSRVQHLVLDEADKLFEMGFVEQIDGIVAACIRPGIQRALFSATLPDTVEELARSIMHDPVRIVVGDRNSASKTVKQKLVYVGSEEGKLLAIRQMFQQGLHPPVLVFVQSKDRAKELHKELAYDGVKVDAIHADRTQAQREHAVDSFRAGGTWVLIATDLMGRGMDFKGVNHVVNYDFPPSIASYIHRIGRSGRAGRPGEATTFYTEDDTPMLRSIANVMKASGCEVPDWLLALPKQGRHRKNHVPKRKPISTVPRAEIQAAKRKREMIAGSKRRKAKAAQSAPA